MNTLVFVVNGQMITRTDNLLPVAKCRNLYRAKFDFKNANWDGIKTALFKMGNKPKAVILDENDECDVPWEFFDTEKTAYGTVSVFCGDLVTANKESVLVMQSGYEQSEASEPPTPDIYNQILEVVDDTKQIAQSVRDDADKGLFNGKDGDDGKSAYEIAVSLGFVGTEQQWIDSLRYDHSDEFAQLTEQVRQALETEGNRQNNAIVEMGTEQKEAITNEGTLQKKSVTDAGEEQVEFITEEGNKQRKSVEDEGTKQLEAVNKAVEGIVAEREQITQNKEDITQLKEDFTNLMPRVEKLEKDAQTYSEAFFKNFFAMQRTGKVYTVRFPLWETSQVATGEKLDDNEGLVMEASTLTEKGRDDYSSIPLFKTYDCNVEYFLGKPKVTAMRGDKEFDSKEKDTFVLGMSYYHKFWIDGGYMYYSRSDSPHEGFVICQEARKTKGERPFCLYAKYVSGTNSKGELGSFYGKNPTRSKISFNSSLSEAKKRGTGYIFGCSADYAYIQNTFMLKYANRNWNTVLGGSFVYNYQYKITTPEEDTKRVILSKANAESFIIGSCVSVGDIGDNGSKDRGSSIVHNICDSVKVLDIVDVGETNKALVLDVKNNITTTATTWVTSMHWRSGFSDRIKGTDGCPCDAKSQISSMKYPTVFQGIELAVGGYEVLGNAFMDILTDPLARDTYVCDDSEKLTNNVATAKASWKKVAKQLAVEKNDAWCYGTELHMDLESGINVITKAGASGSGSNTGFCDGVYFDRGTNTQREFLLLGVLWNWGVCGAFCSGGGSGLGGAGWIVLARLSLSIYRGEFA